MLLLYGLLVSGLSVKARDAHECEVWSIAGDGYEEEMARVRTGSWRYRFSL